MKIEISIPDEVLRNFFEQSEQRLLNKLVEIKENRKVPTDKTSYLTRKEASNKLKISLPTLHNWIKSGKLPISRVGRRVLIREIDLERFLKDLADESRVF